MRFVLIFIIIFSATLTQGQDTKDLDKYSIDTIFQSKLVASKIVVYKYRNVYLYLDFEKFMKEIEFNKSFGYGIKNAKKLLTSYQKDGKKQAKISDTIYLSQDKLDKVGWWPFDRFICNQIDKGTCVVGETNNSIKSYIIRVTGSSNFEGFWKGRRYYLQKQETYFIKVTDMVS